MTVTRHALAHAISEGTYVYWSALCVSNSVCGKNETHFTINILFYVSHTAFQTDEKNFLPNTREDYKSNGKKFSLCLTN
jgi:hypothetical protein